jgi:hypothetical protein
MRLRVKLLISAAIVIMTLGGIAVAQPTLLIPSPTGEEVINAANQGAMQSFVKLTQIRDSRGYMVAAPLTGASLTIGNDTSIVVLEPAGTISTLTLALPVAPQDGASPCIWSSQIVSTLTLNAPGTTIVGGVTTLAAASDVCYLYVLSTKTWHRTA